MRLLWRLYLRWSGWTITGSFPYALKKCIVLVGPHTSSWDFVIGLALRSELKLHHARYFAKAELFRWPFGILFRKTGGLPVHRDTKHNMVNEIVHILDTHEEFLLVLSPEGTRKKVDRLRTGFYHIASETQVPIVMAGFDFEKKQVLFSEPFYVSGDERADFARIYRFYAGIKGKHPEQGMMHFSNPLS